MLLQVAFNQPSSVDRNHDSVACQLNVVRYYTLPYSILKMLVTDGVNQATRHHRFEIIEYLKVGLRDSLEIDMIIKVRLVPHVHPPAQV
tara:strand:- start:2062 stop:2328 length:267 start_codon:yes stop_codon:yes gene_type:complete